ncbi:MAG TPA: peptidylprolyl isomerase [Planctomycetota bacterium]|nr:peptidylprolyl isomerase [Planctomycetota bacterium]
MSTIAVLAVLWLQAQAPMPGQGPLTPEGQTAPSPLSALTQPKIPELTPEQKAERLMARLTSLEARIAALRKVAGASDDPGGASPEAPPATLEGIRDALNDIARDLHRKGRPLELRAVASDAAARFKSRVPPDDAFTPAPETKSVAIPPPSMMPTTPTAATTTAVSIPDIDTARAGDVICRVDGKDIRRGDLEAAVALRMRRLPGGNRTSAARLALGQSLVPIAALKSRRGPEVDALLARAKGLREEIVSGKRTFDACARAEATDKMGRAFGGLLDGVAPSMFSDADLAVLDKLKPGDVSEPFVDGNCVTLLQLIQEKAGVEPAAAVAGVTPPASPTIQARRLRLGLAPGAEKSAELEIADAAYDAVMPGGYPRKAKSGK